VAPKIKNASASWPALNQGWRAFSQVEIQWLFGKLLQRFGKFQLSGSSNVGGWFVAAQGKRQLVQVLPRS